MPTDTGVLGGNGDLSSIGRLGANDKAAVGSSSGGWRGYSENGNAYFVERVGIGMANPTSPLDVIGLIKSTVSAGGTGGFDIRGGDLELTGGFWFSEPAVDSHSTSTTDLFDFAGFVGCSTGPDASLTSVECPCVDRDGDDDADLHDFEILQVSASGA